MSPRQFDPRTAVDLSHLGRSEEPGADGEPPEVLDLSGEIDDQMYRKALLSIASSIAESLGEIVFHLERACPITANGVNSIANGVGALVKKFDEVSLVEDPTQDASGEQSQEATSDDTSA